MAAIPVVSLNLIVKPVYNGTANITICSNQLPYNWNGITVIAGGAAAATYMGLGAVGCDSIVVLNLTVNPIYTGAVTATSVQQPASLYLERYYGTGRRYRSRYLYRTRANGCDSIVTLNLNVTPVVVHNVNMTKCPDQLPFVWNGITVTAGGIAVATFTATSAAGCDSIAHLNLSGTASGIQYTFCIRMQPGSI